MPRQFKLTKSESDYLKALKKSGSKILGKFNRATIFLLLDKGLPVSVIEHLLDVDRTTIWRIKKKYMTHGLEAALAHADRPGKPVKYTTQHEAELLARIRGPVPAGEKKWTIRLLVKELNKQKGFETITYASVQKLLKKHKKTSG